MSDHDDRRQPEINGPSEADGLDPESAALGARLGALFATRADALVVADVPFEVGPAAVRDVPTGLATLEPASLAVVDDAEGRLLEADRLEPLPVTPLDTRRRGWTTWIAGLAAAAVLVAAIVAVNAVRQPSVDTGNSDPLVEPGGAWAPSWVPDGLELWRVDAAEGDAETVLASETGRPVVLPVVQLFESTVDDTRVLVSVSTLGDEQSSSDATPTTIRGIDGTTRAEQREAPGKPTGTRFEWTEAGLELTALVAESDTATAAALLDSLTFAVPDDPAGGFSEPADGAWTVRTDDPRSAPQTPVIVARYGYSGSRPDGHRSDLEVMTVPAGPAASGVAGYLTTAFLGSIRDDGVAVSFEAADGDRPALLFMVWPDGRTVYVQGDGLDEATTTRIAEGVEPISRDALQARIDDLSVRLGTGDVLATADLPSGRVEVIGTPAASAICLTASGRRVCKGSDLNAATGVPFYGSVLVDGSWLLFAAVDGGQVGFMAGTERTPVAMESSIEAVESPSEGMVSIPTTLAEGTPSSPVDTGPSTTVRPIGGDLATSGTTPGTAMPGSSGPFESTVSGSWTLAMFAAPADATSVTIDTTGRSATFLRPTL